MAARMESTGVANLIHVSSRTYDQLVAAGKAHWCKEREDLVEVKGKGYSKTYFVNPNSQENISTSMESDQGSKKYEQKESISNADRTTRLVEWNVDILKKSICAIVAHRESMGSQHHQQVLISQHEDISSKGIDVTSAKPEGEMIVDEVAEVIELPKHRSTVGYDSTEVKLPPEVEKQLSHYVSTIASTYRNNPFHNFEHASHVTMSVVKLLSRIEAPDEKELKRNSTDKVESTCSGDDHT